jgi:hypothetical protein
MGRKTIRAKTFSLLCLIAGGCATPPAARYVYQDGHFGVIAIPKNTTLGKTNFQEQARTLMAQHFPDGYEIVRAEEVIEGQRILDTDKKTVIDTEPSFSALNQMFKLGKLSRTTSMEQKDQIQILESRIIYKKRSPDTPAGSNNFSALASLTPPFYIDPNEVLRCRAGQAIADAKQGTVAKKPGDSETHKVSLEPAKGDGETHKVSLEPAK